MAAIKEEYSQARDQVIGSRRLRRLCQRSIQAGEACGHSCCVRARSSGRGHRRRWRARDTRVTSTRSKEIGSRTSGSRRQEETDLARFWIATASQNWNPVARQMSIARGLTLSQNARAFALLNLAGADAFIAAWDAKFTYRQWRPVTAIRAADTDGNRRARMPTHCGRRSRHPAVSRLHRRPHHICRRGSGGARARVRRRSWRCDHDDQRDGQRAGPGRGQRTRSVCREEFCWPGY